MKLYKTRKGNVLETANGYYLIDQGWDQLINHEGLYGYLEGLAATSGSGVTTSLAASEAAEWLKGELLAPVGSQEVWAAGVTYLRSRDARMEESKDSGGADFYDKVYEADRPELFFKSQAHRVAAYGEDVYIRKDSKWNVPEPELALFINSQGQIAGYTIGNDMSSRDIEGENPLYLPQAKVYERSAALGPGLYVLAGPIPLSTMIRMSIYRSNSSVYKGEVAISQIKRKLPELAEWLFKEMDFIYGAFLMTGTCLVPGSEFTLQPGDRVEIGIDGIGTLVNVVRYKP
ncbi:MAG: fumarylacetoacetate hydrolase family protein [Bacteroidetes bacterium]|nr:fumarylacetoacetate hydrolase family protein [Bacteroidota bacterium]